MTKTDHVRLTRWRLKLLDQAPWLARLPQVIEALAIRWTLNVGAPFQQGECACVAPVQRPLTCGCVLSRKNDLDYTLRGLVLPTS